jgi:hypothetical protein
MTTEPDDATSTGEDYTGIPDICQLLYNVAADRRITAREETELRVARELLGHPTGPAIDLTAQQLAQQCQQIHAALTDLAAGLDPLAEHGWSVYGQHAAVFRRAAATALQISGTT